MRIPQMLVFASLLAAPAWGQRARFQINAQTPEGLLLQLAGQESDEAQKIGLYEEFLQKYPKHDGVLYAWEQVLPLYLKAGQLDKAVAAGEAIFAIVKDNPVAGFNALQACEKKKDAACIMTWSANTADAAKKVLERKKPEDEGELEEWTREHDFAKQVITRCEYSLYVGSLQSTQAKEIIGLVENIEKITPTSQYLAMSLKRYLAAAVQENDANRALALCERMAERKVANEEALLFAAEIYLQGGKDPDKAIGYATQASTWLPNAPAPEGVAPAEWENKKKYSMGRALWVAGAAQAAKNDWATSEQTVLEAMKYIEGNPGAADLLPGAYFYLGLANHGMARASKKTDPARLAAAKKYFTLCAGLPSPLQETAKNNLKAIAAGK